MSDRLTIYYDASCALCREELHTLAAHDTAGRLRLVDVSTGELDAYCREAGLTRDALMSAIHARDGAGRWHRGVPVFALAYAAGGLHGVARLWMHPWLRPLWQRLYPWVARHRQGLSRFGLHRPYGWLMRVATARASRRAAGQAGRCREGRCTAGGDAQ